MSAHSITTIPSLNRERLLDRRPVQGVIGVVVTVLVLELLSLTGVIPKAVMPPVSSVLWEALRLIVDASFLADVANTLAAWAVGLGLAIAIGVPAGLLIGTFRPLDEALRAVTEFLRPIPSVALVPLAVLVAGLGLVMQVSLVVFASIWPIMFNTVYGVRDIDPVAKETARTFRIPAAESALRVMLPAAAPFAFTGIRISASIALIVAISSELLAGTPLGIGSFIMRVSASGGDISVVLAATLFAGVLGVLVNAVLKLVERRIFRWREASAS